MADYRSMFDRDYLGVWDLKGKEITVRIAKVAAGMLVAQGNRKSKKPIVWFERAEKGLVCNKTNAKTIAKLYGNNTEDWIGKPITLYPTTTTMGSETVECIRVKPAVPRSKSQGIESQPVDQEIRERQDRAAGREPDPSSGEVAADDEPPLNDGGDRD